MVITCKRCLTGFEVQEPPIFGGLILPSPVYCPKCLPEAEAEAERERASEKAKQREHQWARICPPAYQSTDPARLAPRLLEVIKSYSVGKLGVGLCGPAGTCKTRAAYLLLRKAFNKGRSVFAITTTHFSRLTAEQFDNARKADAKEALNRARTADVLLLDDLGKGKLTDRAEEGLFELLDYRISYESPIIWTSNANGAEFLSMLSKDRGEPILRRLVESVETVLTIDARPQ